MRDRLIPLRDAALATALLLVAVYAGSGRLARLDPALLGYLGAVVATTFAIAWRVSAFWRRPASLVYARALRSVLARPRALRQAFASAGGDLAAQRFIARRSRLRWLAHLLLSGGTLAAVAITLPLVCGWLQFAAEGQDTYRAVVMGVPTLALAVDGPLGWLVFHALSLSGVAVTLGAAYFLVLRLRHRARPGTATGFHLAPLGLLLVVALSGLALPATSGLGVPGLFRGAALLHQLSVTALLLALPASKLGHLLVRPLQVGVRLVRAPEAARIACAGCGTPLAPRLQHAAVVSVLAARGFAFGAHADRCQPCRRRMTATAQAVLQNADFQPPLLGARPATRTPQRAA